MRLVKFAKECKEKKLRSFSLSSYKTKKELKELLGEFSASNPGRHRSSPQATEL